MTDWNAKIENERVRQESERQRREAQAAERKRREAAEQARTELKREQNIRRVFQQLEVDKKLTEIRDQIWGCGEIKTVITLDPARQHDNGWCSLKLEFPEAFESGFSDYGEGRGTGKWYGKGWYYISPSGTSLSVIVKPRHGYSEVHVYDSHGGSYGLDEIKIGPEGPTPEDRAYLDKMLAAACAGRLESNNLPRRVQREAEHRISELRFSGKLRANEHGDSLPWYRRLF